VEVRVREARAAASGGGRREKGERNEEETRLRLRVGARGFSKKSLGLENLHIKIITSRSK